MPENGVGGLRDGGLLFGLAIVVFVGSLSSIVLRRGELLALVSSGPLAPIVSDTTARIGRKSSALLRLNLP